MAKKEYKTFITGSIIYDFLNGHEFHEYNRRFKYKHGASGVLHISFDHEDLRVRMFNGESLLYFHFTPFSQGMVDIAYIGQQVDSMSTVGRESFWEVKADMEKFVNFVATKFFNVAV